MRRFSHRVRSVLSAVVSSLVCLLALSSCGAPNFGALQEDLQFGGTEVDTDTPMQVDETRIPQGGLSSLLTEKVLKQMDDLNFFDKTQIFGGNFKSHDRETMVSWLKRSPDAQCTVLTKTVQSDSPQEGAWSLEPNPNRCVKKRQLSWLEATVWDTYSRSANSNLEWLTTSRNTLTVDESRVGALQATGQVDYDAWETKAGPYLNVALGVLIIIAIISLAGLGMKIAWNARQGDSDPFALGKLGWVFLGLLLGSSAGSIAMVFFHRTTGTKTPSLASWTPGGGTTTTYLSDWIRLQLDPIIIIAAGIGVIAAGARIAMDRDHRGLVRIGQAFGKAVITAILLAGLVNTLQTTLDTWTADILKASNEMVSQAYGAGTLSTGSFFGLGPILAVFLTILLWFFGLVMKIFAYLRAGLLPILVAMAPFWAVMSWTEQGKQAFGKTLGWLIAFLTYKPAAALVMAASGAIMATGVAGDDSTAITVTMTFACVILLPGLIRLIVPATEGMVGGGGGIMPAVLGAGVGAGVTAAGVGVRGIGSLVGAKTGSGSHSSGSPNGAKKSGGGSGSSGSSSGSFGQKVGATVSQGAQSAEKPSSSREAPSGVSSSSSSGSSGGVREHQSRAPEGVQRVRKRERKEF